MKLIVQQENDQKPDNCEGFYEWKKTLSTKNVTEKKPTFELKNALVEKIIGKYKTTYLNESCAT